MSSEERVLKEINANYTQEENRAVGGKLTITNESVQFSPHKIDELTGGEKLQIPVDKIANVGVEKKFNRGLKDALKGGGLRDRLRIELVGGEEELFVVSNVNEVVEDVQMLINGNTEEVSKIKGEDPELGNILLKVIAYISGSIAIILGILYLPSGDFVVAILLSLAGTIGMPYTRRKLESLLGIKINKWTATVIFIVCWLTASQLLA